MVLGAGLAACGGHDTAGGTRPSDDPTSLPSRTPPSTESAHHFIRRWAAAEARMENTGKTAEYLALSRQCPVCRSLAHNIARRYAAGGYIRWDGLRIDSIDTPPTSQGVVLYTVHAHSAPITVRDSPSRPEQHFPAHRVTYLVGVMSGRRSYGVTSVTLS